MNFKNLLKVYFLTLISTVLVFLLAIKIVLFLLKTELDNSIKSKVFEKYLYTLTIKTLVNFSEKKPNVEDKAVIKESINKLYKNYYDVFSDIKK